MPQMGIIIIRTYIHYGAQIFTSLQADSTIYDVNDWVLDTFILFFNFKTLHIHTNSKLKS